MAKKVAALITPWERGVLTQTGSLQHLFTAQHPKRLQALTHSPHLSVEDLQTSTEGAFLSHHSRRVLGCVWHKTGEQVTKGALNGEADFVLFGRQTRTAAGSCRRRESGGKHRKLQWDQRQGQVELIPPYTVSWTSRHSFLHLLPESQFHLQVTCFTLPDLWPKHLCSTSGQKCYMDFLKNRHTLQGLL